MSILIKGLTLPRTCVFPCIVAVADNRLLISDVNENTIFEGEYAEVPTPHGRKKAIHSRYCPSCGASLFPEGCDASETDLST